MRGKNAELVDLSLVGAKVSGGRSMVPNGDRRVADIAIWHLVILFVIAENKHSREGARIVFGRRPRGLCIDPFGDASLRTLAPLIPIAGRDGCDRPHTIGISGRSGGS